MLQSMGLQRVGHDWATELNFLIYEIRDWTRLLGFLLAITVCDSLVTYVKHLLLEQYHSGLGKYERNVRYISCSVGTLIPRTHWRGDTKVMSEDVLTMDETVRCVEAGERM